MIKKSKEIRPIKKSVADKAYDSEKLHSSAEQEGFLHIAPLKNDVSIWRTKG